MKRKGMALLNLFMATLLLCSVSTAFGEEYEGIASVKSAKVIWDESESNPKFAVLHLKLIHQTYKDFAAMKKAPVFVIVFSGPSVKLTSKNREGFSDPRVHIGSCVLIGSLRIVRVRVPVSV